jgi:hypothetical protein
MGDAARSPRQLGNHRWLRQGAKRWLRDIDNHLTGLVVRLGKNQGYSVFGKVLQIKGKMR